MPFPVFDMRWAFKLARSRRGEYITEAPAGKVCPIFCYYFVGQAFLINNTLRLDE